MLASATPDQFAESLRIVLADPGVDNVMIIFPTPPMFTAGSVAKAIIPVIHSADKPVVVAVMGERLIQEAVEHLRAAQVPEYRFAERAAAALAALVARAELLEYAQAEPLMPVQTSEVFALHFERSKETKTSEVFSLLKAYGIPTAKMELAQSPDEAAAFARQMGTPVALKIASPEISHKSDVGGVLLSLGDEAAVRTGYEEILQRARSAQPQADIQGVYVQRMIPSGQEVIIGAVQDAQFGAQVMFGSGGTEVEGLKDIAFGLAPLTQIEAERMLESTCAGRKLKGFRNLPAADRDAVLELPIRLAQLAADHPDPDEIEINPLRVLPYGQGAVAVDVRIQAAGCP
ncbi:MAG: acetate--CoA ligase family protein [Chloroflexi bacterium]|nr:acetate--CoA ligase family protein [Chloroflexota bacterium]